MLKTGKTIWWLGKYETIYECQFCGHQTIFSQSEKHECKTVREILAEDAAQSDSFDYEQAQGKIK